MTLTVVSSILPSHHELLPQRDKLADQQRREYLKQRLKDQPKPLSLGANTVDAHNRLTCALHLSRNSSGDLRSAPWITPDVSEAEVLPVQALLSPLISFIIGTCRLCIPFRFCAFCSLK
jgi:hypothetical protein